MYHKINLYQILKIGKLTILFVEKLQFNDGNNCEKLKETQFSVSPNINKNILTKN